MLQRSGLLLNGIAGGALGADEQHLAAFGRHALDEGGRLRVEGLGLLQIDDVDLVTLAENERGHFRVPEAGLMSEMDTRFQHLSHRHAGHDELLGWVEPPRVPIGNPGLESAGNAFRFEVPGHPADCVRHACGVVKNSRALYHERYRETNHEWIQ